MVKLEYGIQNLEVYYRGEKIGSVSQKAEIIEVSPFEVEINPKDVFILPGTIVQVFNGLGEVDRFLYVVEDVDAENVLLRRLTSGKKVNRLTNPILIPIERIARLG